MNLTDITLIVPTKNEASNIGSFLDSVPPEIKIIIVDAGTDNTVDIIMSRERPSIRILKDDGNIPAARQIAAEHAQTDWLFFSDADVGFDHNYFTILSHIILSPHHGGLVGAKLSRNRYRYYYMLFSQWLRLCCFLGLPGASGSNMLVNRRALFDVGGFDLSLSCNEDTELIRRMQRKGYRIDYDGRLKVFEFDHRRLDGGVPRKTIHNLTRCILLLCGLQRLLRSHDWGYWRSPSDKKRLALHSKKC